MGGDRRIYLEKLGLRDFRMKVNLPNLIWKVEPLIPDILLFLLSPPIAIPHPSLSRQLLYQHLRT